MLDKVSDFIVCDMLFKNETISDEQKEVMVFGVKRILEDTPKYIAIIGICIYLNLLKELLIVLLVTASYKTFVGGAHARTNLECFISSLVIFLTPILLPIYINFSSTVMYILYSAVCISSLYIIIKVAPGDTEEIPILKKKRRTKMKIKASIIFTIWYFSAIFIIDNMYNKQIILLTILFINIMATDIAYKVFRCKHSYETEEFAEYFNK